MEITVILSGLALLAATVSLCLEILAKKRSKERNVALDKYIATEFERIDQRLKDLESGVIPDHEEAKRAIDSLNSFNRGLASIAGYDPFEVLERDRKRATGEDE